MLKLLMCVTQTVGRKLYVFNLNLWDIYKDFAEYYLVSDFFWK